MAADADGGVGEDEDAVGDDGPAGPQTGTRPRKPAVGTLCFRAACSAPMLGSCGEMLCRVVGRRLRRGYSRVAATWGCAEREVLYLLSVVGTSV